MNKQIPNFSIKDIGNDKILTLSGNSIPEDADYFYFPLIRQLQDLIKKNINVKKNIIFDFRLDYYNTASTHYITRILKIISDHSVFAKVSINWFYMDIDEEMYELGLDYKESLPIDIKLIERKTVK